MLQNALNLAQNKKKPLAASVPQTTPDSQMRPPLQNPKYATVLDCIACVIDKCKDGADTCVNLYATKLVRSKFTQD